jgi:pyruvate,water dikinase
MTVTQRDQAIERLLRDLQERAKELQCLYAVEELLGGAQTDPRETLRGVIEAIPHGWQYPDICLARITFDGEVHASPNFVETPWVQRARILSQGDPVGSLEVFYTQAMPAVDEGPFLKEERKLIDTIADRLGNWVTHRRLVESMERWRSAQRALAGPPTSEWAVIVDLLRRTDQGLLVRLARKLINHLGCSGVKQAEQLLRRVSAAGQAGAEANEENRPRERDGLPAPDVLVEEAFRLAAAHLGDEELLACIHKWIKLDRAGFLIHAVENHETSLSELADAIHRFLCATHGEAELTPSTLKGLRVSLVRRLLNDQLEFIQIAKSYVEIADFHELLGRMIYPADGHGKLGGKSAGLFLAQQIIRAHAGEDATLAEIRFPRTWYVTSDGLPEFIYANHLEDVFTQKYKDIDEVRQEYAAIVQVFKNSQMPAELLKGLSVALDDLGEVPLIVRSSSLLEDRFGAAFSGKYKSLFLANRGTKRERLAALADAIAEVYASTFAPDPIEYRAERGLLDFHEGMAILIQEVVGTQVGRYFLPSWAGVAFSRNEFRWSPRIRPQDGLVRLVPGLGTRAVDRLGDDYPILAAPGQPGLRVNATVEEAIRYSPRYVDVINLESCRFETVEAAALLRECGAEWPAVEQIVSIHSDGHLAPPPPGAVRFDRDGLAVTFDGLLNRSDFLRRIRALLALLERETHTPVDIEFACDGRHLYLLQCRAQNLSSLARPAPIPRDIPDGRIVFSAHRHISNGSVHNVTHIVYVDPQRYAQLGSLEELLAVGRAVGRLNKLLPKRQFVLMGPGRWGSRGDIKLGVRVTYSDINNTAMLIEIARRKGEYTPDLSFGTHFFQDLVEASIRYLPLYPDDPGVVFNESLLNGSPNILGQVAPEFAHLADTVRVIDVPGSAAGRVLNVLTNADLDEAIGFLAAPSEAISALPEAISPAGEAQRGQDWRWRLRMAERIAAQLDADRFGVVALYLFGSVKNATAGPSSDIDLLVHFRGTPEQREALERWLEGWSLCLSEMNYLRSGYQTAGLLDAHFVTDEDIARRTSFAVKIDAVTDAARPLALKGAVGTG